MILASRRLQRPQRIHLSDEVVVRSKPNVSTKRKGVRSPCNTSLSPAHLRSWTTGCALTEYLKSAHIPARHRGEDRHNEPAYGP